MTYGDGLADVNLKKLVDFHKKNKKNFYLNCRKTSSKVWCYKIKGNYVNYFKEKNSLDEGWINGGYFVIEPKFFKYKK